jgi:hypothetical protein
MEIHAMSSSYRLLLVCLTAIVTVSCASVPQPPLSFTQQSVGAQAGKVGVVMTALPKVDTQFPGAFCLLCLATASLANTTLTSYANTLPYEDIPKFKQMVADSLKKRGTDVLLIEESLDLSTLDSSSDSTPNMALKRFGPLQQKYNVDRLVVIDIGALGFERPYAAYVPTGDPKAYLRGSGYLVNLRNNMLEWFYPLNVNKGTDKTWDEPPKFPGLTNAYFQVLEIAKDNLLKEFSGEQKASTVPRIGNAPAASSTPTSGGANLATPKTGSQ